MHFYTNETIYQLVTGFYLLIGLGKIIVHPLRFVVLKSGTLNGVLLSFHMMFIPKEANLVEISIDGFLLWVLSEGE